jgi:hypothetical protein
MRKFIKKYYQEIIAVLLIAGFWTGIYGYRGYHTAKANAFRAAHTYQYSPDLIH